MSQTKMEQFREMFAERLGVKNVDESKSLRDLGLDSLDVVEIPTNKPNIRNHLKLK